MMKVYILFYFIAKYIPEHSCVFYSTVVSHISKNQVIEEINKETETNCILRCENDKNCSKIAYQKSDTHILGKCFVLKQVMDFKRYTKLFNYGYFLSKYEPKILKSLLKATESESSITEPLSAGKSQFVKEQLQEKLKSLDEPSKNDLEKGLEPEI